MKEYDEHQIETFMNFIMHDGVYIDWRGSKIRVIDEMLHGTNGKPAVEHVDGTTLWYVKGELHRIDGPAVEYPDGEVEFWFNGMECYDFDEWLDVNYKLDEEDKTLLKLEWG